MMFMATPLELFNTLWALAKLNHRITDEQLQSLVTSFLSRVSQATPHAVSVVIWSVATMGQPAAG